MLEVNDLSISFSRYAYRLKKRRVCAIRCLELFVNTGEVLAVVGQSGAGKSLLAHALLGLLPKNASMTGVLTFKGKKLTNKEIKRLRGRQIALIPQSVTYLNPLLRVGVQIARAAELGGVSSAGARQIALDAIQRYALKEETARCFPFQLSGGMTRRILTAMATVGGADLILADEPTNGLDRGNAKETLMGLRRLAHAGKAVLLITHDIEAALSIADRVSVFCGGITVEEALASDFKKQDKLRHPYTRALWEAVPGRRFVDALPTSALVSPNGGCPFKALCSKGGISCDDGLPAMRSVGGGRVRCRNA
jgi:peptide/nickel transport system ATP-binding protein